MVTMYIINSLYNSEPTMQHNRYTPILSRNKDTPMTQSQTESEADNKHVEAQQLQVPTTTQDDDTRY
jgi:hypothetical protein